MNSIDKARELFMNLECRGVGEASDQARRMFFVQERIAEVKN